MRMRTTIQRTSEADFFFFLRVKLKSPSLKNKMFIKKTMDNLEIHTDRYSWQIKESLEAVD